MAITSDGAQAFGISTGNETFDTLVVENFTLTTPSNRVDLDDGNGEPLGATIVPQRVEATLTCQIGAGHTLAIGDPITYNSLNFLVTSFDVTETQADYQRVTINAFVKKN